MIREKLIQSRKKLGWTQQDLANKSGFSRSSIINWETGRRAPRSVDIERLAKALGTSAAYLMSETDNPEPHIENEENENKNLPIINVEDKEPENNNLSLSYWGTVADNARKIANEGNAQEKAAVMMMLNMAVNAFNEAQGTGNFLPQAVGFQGNNNQVHNNYVRT